MDEISLEICSFSYNGCLNASLGGANRIELCDSPLEGGTTPSYGLVKLVKEKLDIAVYPIIRPRGGNFVYSDEEFEIMCLDVKAFKALGCDGIAVGLQKKDGSIDISRLRRLIDIAWPMGVTCIRAFDLVPNVFKALDDLIDCGCERILTSGQALFAYDAIPLIKELVGYANGKISIMPGSGVRPDNVDLILKETGATEIHTSVRIPKEGTSGTNEEKLGFGHGMTCDLEQIKQIREIINNL